MVALPFCHLNINAYISTCYGYPSELKTLGDHILTARLDRGEMQIEAMQQLGISQKTLINWEKNRSQPMVTYYPRIMDYLGYCPYQAVVSFGQKLKLHRQYAGLTKTHMAELLGVDVATIGRWETDRTCPLKRHYPALTQFGLAKKGSLSRELLRVGKVGCARKKYKI